MKRNYSVILALCLSLNGALPAGAAQTPPPGDRISQGLWWLYHLQYDKARMMFDRYISEYPQEPAGYFYKTAVDWWQLAQKADYYLPDVQAKLELDYQATVGAARDLYESTQDPKTQARAYLYWGGANGLKGRWLVTQHQWIRAYFLGKDGHNQLKKAISLDPTLYDAYLGLGIYDYFTDTLPGVQKVLAALFIHGNRKRGLEELQWAIDKGNHSRVEAKAFLIEIYTWEEGHPEKAIGVTEDLRRDYPDSPMTHLAEIMTLYEMRRWDDVAREARVFLEKSEKESPWYTREGIRPGLYCVGTAAFYGHHDTASGMSYMNDILNKGIDSSRWVTFAFLRRGQIYDVLGERDKAVVDYQTVLARPNFWGSHRQAQAYLKQAFKFAN